ncbi:MAG: hypothetical protein B7Z43_07370, partial [Sphingomonas sp. 12-62-6]
MANSEPLAQAYADHLRRNRRRSVHTVRAYRATADRLIAFLGEHWGSQVDPAAGGGNVGHGQARKDPHRPVAAASPRRNRG